jgi:hypothetical protein
MDDGECPVSGRFRLFNARSLSVRYPPKGDVRVRRDERPESEKKRSSTENQGVRSRVSTLGG